MEHTATYIVTDCEFNRAHYDQIIGHMYSRLPGYARVNVFTVGHCELCKGGHSLINGLCYNCRNNR